MPGHQGVSVLVPSLDSKPWLRGHTEKNVPNRIEWNLPSLSLSFLKKFCFNSPRVRLFHVGGLLPFRHGLSSGLNTESVWTGRRLRDRSALQ